MSHFRELLAVDHKQALEFFALRLQDVSDPDVDRQLLFYNASVLAHHSQVSIESATDVPTPANLSTVYDNFVVDTTLLGDCRMMETAGVQCLLLAGFFEDQMRRRHNIRWYAKLGATFFQRASRLEKSYKKAWVLGALSDTFEPWRQRHARLARELRDEPYLITPRRD